MVFLGMKSGFSVYLEAAGARVDTPRTLPLSFPLPAAGLQL